MLSPEQQEEAIQLRKNGMKLDDIAKHFAVSDSLIKNMLYRRGVILRSHPNRKPIDLKQVAKLRAQGQSMDEIAKTMGISTATIHLRIAKEGIKLPKSLVTGHHLKMEARRRISQAQRDRWREQKRKSRTALASTDSPFPPELMNGKSGSHTTTIRERLLAIEVAVAALKADLGL
jgi:transposase